MFKIFFKSFFRNARKSKSFFLINLFGFTLGLTVSLLILLYISHELSYDKYHVKSENIYRLCLRASIGDTKFTQAYSSARNERDMRDRFPEIRNSVKTVSLEDVTSKIGEKVYFERQCVIADSSLFSIFTLPFVNGNPQRALVDPNTIVLNKTTALKYFGTTDCLAEQIDIDVPYMGRTLFRVSGVMADMPEESHFHLDYVVSSTTYPDLLNNPGFASNNFVSYLLLQEGTNIADLEARMMEYVYDYYGGKEAYEKASAQGNYWEYFLQPLESIHLHSEVNGEWETNGNIKYIYIFFAVALFVLIIACINFVNLSIAKSSLRAREVGIRKATGSSRRLLITQFLGESTLLTFLALGLSLLLISLLLPAYNNWLNRNISMDLLEGGKLGIVLGGGLLISLLTGLYPAFFLSSYKPVKVLKAKTISETRGLGLRNVLVIMQFAASIFLIISTLVIRQEMSLLKDGELGFEKTGVLLVQTPPSFAEKRFAMREELSRLPSVVEVSGSYSLPGMTFSNVGFSAEGIDKSFTLNLMTVDENYQHVLKLKLKEGRFFDPSRPSDSTAVVLNQKAVEVLGMENPIGKHVDNNRGDDIEYEIIGIVEDYHYESKHMEVRPLGLFFQGGPMTRPERYLSIRYPEGMEDETLAGVEKLWAEMMPAVPLRHSFLEQEYDAIYHNEQQTQEVFTLMSFLAILVACLGLFGLASFIAQQRKAEVAIRKVMGASLQHLIAILSGRYIKWLAIAFLLACPLAWYVMSGWLENFAYQVKIGPLVYLIAGVSTLALALITVSSITGRTANSNPATVLRNE